MVCNFERWMAYLWMFVTILSMLLHFIVCRYPSSYCNVGGWLVHQQPPATKYLSFWLLKHKIRIVQYSIRSHVCISNPQIGYFAKKPRRRNLYMYFDEWSILSLSFFTLLVCKSYISKNHVCNFCYVIDNCNSVMEDLLFLLHITIHNLHHCCVHRGHRWLIQLNSTLLMLEDLYFLLHMIMIFLNVYHCCVHHGHGWIVQPNSTSLT